MNSLWVFLSAFGVSATAGLANLLRTGQEVTRKSVLTCMLNCGMLGLAICLLWYSQFQDNLYFLVGLCVVAGLGGVATIDYVTDLFKKLLAIRLGVNNEQVGKGPSP